MGHSVILVEDSDWQISYQGKESLKPVLNEEIRGFCDIDTTLKLFVLWYNYRDHKGSEGGLYSIYI